MGKASRYMYLFLCNWSTSHSRRRRLLRSSDSSVESLSSVAQLSIYFCKRKANDVKAHLQFCSIPNKLRIESIWCRKRSLKANWPPLSAIEELAVLIRNWKYHLLQETHLLKLQKRVTQKWLSDTMHFDHQVLWKPLVSQFRVLFSEDLESFRDLPKD